MKPLSSLNNSKPIGVFDSGLGGLTVLKELEKNLPNESFIYFGDTANLPYGSKSPKNIQNYAIQITEFLINHNVKLIIIACNTASSVALDVLKKRFDIPIFGVVSPSVKEAINSFTKGIVGVIGTQSTISSNSYLSKFNSLNPSIRVIQKACPLFVPLIEENWATTAVANQVAKTYLKSLTKEPLSVLVLGCTHYPIMEPLIQSVVGNSVKLISSGPAVSKTIKKFLYDNCLQNSLQKTSNSIFFVTDFPEKFNQLGRELIGRPLKNVQHIRF